MNNLFHFLGYEVKHLPQSLDYRVTDSSHVFRYFENNEC